MSVSSIDDNVREEMLFIKSLPETTHGEDIFNHIMQYCNDKDIPLTNLICIASGGATAMTGRVKGFVSRMKSVAPHISHVHCIIHWQHLAAKKLEETWKKHSMLLYMQLTLIKQTH